MAVVSGGYGAFMYVFLKGSLVHVLPQHFKKISCKKTKKKKNVVYWASSLSVALGSGISLRAVPALPHR